jgi:ribosome biogenesis GTPase / thiamine phosphate phosphatase
MSLTLEKMGWNSALAEAFQPHAQQGRQPARLIRDNKVTYGALLASGEQYEVVMSGKLYHAAKTNADLPAVGDWVALEVSQAEHNPIHVIKAQLPRLNTLSRKAPGRSTEEQVIAANVDIVVLVTESGPDFNLRRIERYFALISRCGAKPVVLLNKSDLFPDQQNQEAARSIQALNPSAAVHITNTTKRNGLRPLLNYCQTGITLSLVGSSGVGKSSIINQLFGDDYQWTDEVNSLTGKGRHTTTARELMILPKGGILIDNPGIREVHLWTDENSLQERFPDIEELATRCKFSNCQHAHNAGCAVQAAIEKGQLEQARFHAYQSLEKEVATLKLSHQKRRLTLDRRELREQRQHSQYYAERNNPDLNPNHRPRKNRS